MMASRYRGLWQRAQPVLLVPLMLVVSRVDASNALADSAADSPGLLEQLDTQVIQGVRLSGRLGVYDFAQLAQFEPAVSGQPHPGSAHQLRSARLPRCWQAA